MKKFFILAAGFLCITEHSHAGTVRQITINQSAHKQVFASKNMVESSKVLQKATKMSLNGYGKNGYESPTQKQFVSGNNPNIYGYKRQGRGNGYIYDSYYDTSYGYYPESLQYNQPVENIQLIQIPVRQQRPYYSEADYSAAPKLIKIEKVNGYGNKTSADQQEKMQNIVYGTDASITIYGYETGYQANIVKVKVAK